jgi:hypothetical protein
LTVRELLAFLDRSAWKHAACDCGECRTYGAVIELAAVVMDAVRRYGEARKRHGYYTAQKKG